MEFKNLTALEKLRLFGWVPSKNQENPKNRFCYFKFKGLEDGYDSDYDNDSGERLVIQKDEYHEVFGWFGEQIKLKGGWVETKKTPFKLNCGYHKFPLELSELIILDDVGLNFDDEKSMLELAKHTMHIQKRAMLNRWMMPYNILDI